MINAEAQKRRDLASKLSQELSSFSEGIILVGSVAHSPNKVRTDSDLDLIAVVDDLYGIVNQVTRDNKVRGALRNRVFDGYCTKDIRDNVATSIHFLSEDAFDIISKCNVADIRVYRPDPKQEDYTLFGFEGQNYPYWIKNIELRELPGARTIVPVSFIYSSDKNIPDRYYIGIHRDKLLSKPAILYDASSIISTKIDKLWQTVVFNLMAEAKRLYGKLDINKMNVLNALSRKDSMSSEAQQFVMDQTKHYVNIL